MTVSTVFSDPAENPLSEGGVWTKPASTDAMRKTGGAAGPANNDPPDSDPLAVYTGATFTSNQYSKMTLANVGSDTWSGTSCRMDALQADGYTFDRYTGGGDDLQIARWDDAAGVLSYTILGATLSVSKANGDTYELRAHGANLWGLKNGLLLFIRSDSTYSSGHGGISGYRNNSLPIDAWEAGDYAPTGPWHDTSSEAVRTDTSSPMTWSHPGAASGVKGVVVGFVHGTSATDHISAVTYGGTAMTRSVRATDAATEPGAAELWFLGSSVPQGTQTVSATCGATTDDIHGFAWTINASTDLEVIDSDSVSGDAANPSVTLQTSSRRALAFGALYGGGAAPSSFAANSSCLAFQDHDLGAFYSVAVAQVENSTSDFAIGGTAVSDDVAFAALSVAEVVATGSVVDPFGTLGIFGF